MKYNCIFSAQNPGFGETEHAGQGVDPGYQHVQGVMLAMGIKTWGCESVSTFR